MNKYLMTYRFIKHFSMLLFIVLPLQLFGMLALLPLVYFYPGKNTLPRIFRWYDNADQFVGRDTSVYYSVADSGYWSKYYWLAIRNPLNYFGYAVLGFVPTKMIRVIADSPRPHEKDIGDTSNEGFYYGEVEVDGKIYYEYYIIIKYSKNSNKCVRIRVGHKMEHTAQLEIGEPCQWVCVFSPYHSYTGT